jgi:molybdopterin-binding protein
VSDCLRTPATRLYSGNSRFFGKTAGIFLTLLPTAGGSRSERGAQWGAGNHAGQAAAHARRGGVMLSARNQLGGAIKSITLGSVMAEVIITIGPIELVSVITRASAEHMALKVGDRVTAVVKSTEVMVAKD